jgi:KaiC/GvpD/RAD55 family RecA-like ATPase
VKSGHTPKKESVLLEGLSEKEASVLKQHANLGVDFSSATNADEARALLEAAKAAKN